eukprot:m.139858 g.139858  ORF g.139858 m.139858 type:complete len:797 (+) comp17643_c0_seq5:96-2486(+)
MARRLSAVLATTSVFLGSASGNILVEHNCLAVGEVESAAATGSWQFGSSIANHAGSGYYTWTGPNHFGSTGHGTLEYSLQITTPGEYTFAIRNYHSDPDPTESNDVWLKVGGNSWVKCYSELVGMWQWMFKMDVGHGDTERPPKYTLNAGTHTIKLSGRSNGFSIDRIHVYQESCVNMANARNAFFTPSGAGPAPPQPAPVASLPTQPPVAQPAPSPSVGADFVEIMQPSRGCCRTSSLGSGQEVLPVLTGHTQAQCEALCAADTSCTGYEYHTWTNGCELHTGAGDFYQTSGYELCRCVQKRVVVGSPPVSAAPTTNAPTSDTATAAPTTAAPTTAAPTGTAVGFGQDMVEQNCLAVGEVEAIAPTSGWVLETEVADYSGSGYFRWAGPNYFATKHAGKHGLLTYTLRIERAGLYQVRIRNYHDFHDDTEENDCWLKVGTHGWEKVFSNVNYRWTWQSKFDLHLFELNPMASYQLSAGEHQVLISGRSTNFRIDRIHVFDMSCANSADYTNPHFVPSGVAALPVAPLPITHSSEDYTELSPRGCCRDAAGDGGTPIEVATTTTEHECAARCTANDACAGYEYQVVLQACELHPSESLDHTSPNEQCRCKERGSSIDFGDAVGLELDAEEQHSSRPTPASFQEILPQGCCRTAAGLPGDEADVVVVDDRSQCASMCLGMDTCTGYEWHMWDNGCELHNGVGDFARTLSHEQCQCFQKIESEPAAEDPSRHRRSVAAFGASHSSVTLAQATLAGMAVMMVAAVVAVVAHKRRSHGRVHVIHEGDSFTLGDTSVVSAC